ncbi:hypothetical protein MALGJ_06790 [Mycolicibacter algericus]|jgi:hypothetical protein|uniref:Uncharacterized protein n=1 Tax=Mycolicibacter algericus TaxID=1288388 RepID=A0A7I9Y687_MYCAL|nr:hypothetical protein MALGJ_06790 [Mycolicibacter algericus]
MAHILKGVEHMRGTATTQIIDAELALVTGITASISVSGLILERVG